LKKDDMVMQLFGVDYYPEHWDEERWPLDAALMQQMGINTVRLAEFAWSKLEPAAGVYDFDWLDRAIEMLASHGIKIILGTPTAAPNTHQHKPSTGIFERGNGVDCTHREGNTCRKKAHMLADVAAHSLFPATCVAFVSRWNEP
jgi:hypothetical protein